MKPDINNYKTELQEWLTKYHHENLQLLEEVGAGSQLADLWVNGDWTATNQILGTIGKEHASRNIASCSDDIAPSNQAAKVSSDITGL